MSRPPGNSSPNFFVSWRYLGCSLKHHIKPLRQLPSFWTAGSAIVRTCNLNPGKEKRGLPSYIIFKIKLFRIPTVQIAWWLRTGQHTVLVDGVGFSGGWSRETRMRADSWKQARWDFSLEKFNCERKKKRYTEKGQRIKGVLNLFVCIIIYIFLFIHLTALGLCSMWDLVPWPEIEPGSPGLGAQCLTHWTPREVSIIYFNPIYTRFNNMQGLAWWSSG